jgi:hypothetical protein
MNDYNLAQMKQLLSKDNVSIVYLDAAGDYWIRQQEFCDAFRSVSPADNVVIHVRFEGLSLTHSLVVPAVEKIINETGRDPNTVYIYSPNSVRADTVWENLFWRQFRVSDEFSRSKTYWCHSPGIEHDFKPWALFVGRQTTPRLLALYDICGDTDLKNNFLLSAMNHPSPDSELIFDRADKIYDKIDDWVATSVENKIQRIMHYNNFRIFCKNLPVSSIDDYSIVDQYADVIEGENRNPNPSKSLIKLGNKYLFELTFETMTRGFTFTPSEKTVRTIVAEKPMVVYAPQHFLENLRNLGFKTWDDLWDESYDHLEGPERYHAIMKLIREVCNWPREQQLEAYQQSREICIHNRLLLLKLSMNDSV